MSLSLMPCASTGGTGRIFYFRKDNPPPAFIYCPPPAPPSCGEDNGSSDEENTTNKDNLVFADGDLSGGVGGDSEPQQTTSEAAQAGQAGVPGDVNNVDQAKVTYSANRDPALRAIRRSAFEDMMDNGVDVNGENFKLSRHAYNSLFKSGRKDIMPADIFEALGSDPLPADPGSVIYTNPITGTKVYVNPDTGQITGVQPGNFI